MKASGSGKNRGAVVITGASSGVGQACAFRLSRMGFHVFAGVRKKGDFEAFQKKAIAGLTPVYLDITDEDAIAQVAQTVKDFLGESGLAGLVNNAGIVVSGPLEFLSVDDFRKQFEVNVFGQVAVTRAFIPLLRKEKGRIVNIGSISGRSAMPLMSAYSASKFALEAINDSLRVELRPWGIQVFILEPGSIATPLFDKFVRNHDANVEKLPTEARRLYATPLAVVRAMARHGGRKGVPPDEIAKVVAHTLTASRPKARYLAGLGPRQMILLEMLPIRLRDWLITRFMDKWDT